MGDHQRRQPQTHDEFAQEGPRFLAQLGIQVGQRLVQQDDRRAVDQGAADGHALLLAAGELVRVALSQLAQAQLVQHILNALAHFAAGHAAQLERIGHVVEHGLVRPKRIRLEHQAQVAVLCRHFLARRAVVYQPIADADTPRLGAFEAGDRAQQGRLAAAGGAEQGHHFALAQVHGHALEDRVVSVVQVQVFDGKLNHEV